MFVCMCVCVTVIVAVMEYRVRLAPFQSVNSRNKLEIRQN